MKLQTIFIFITLSICFFSDPGHADSFTSNWPEEAARHWVGADFWANRLQDWQLRIGRLECIQPDPRQVMRTVQVITCEVTPEIAPFEMTVRTGLLHHPQSTTGNSWSGFLIGAGQGALDYRAASLVHHFSGAGGGLICALDDRGRLIFRDNNDENQRDVYPLIETNSQYEGEPVPRTNWEDIRLTLTAQPTDNGTYTLILKASNFITGVSLATNRLQNFPASQLAGNLALVSHGGKGPAANRYWFRDLKIEGPKIKYHPERQFGPILNTLFSINQNVLKMTVQFPPLGFSDARHVKLYRRLPEKKEWHFTAETRIILPGYTAHFRIPDWHTENDIEFKLVYQNQGKIHHFLGLIPHEPLEKKEFVVAGFTGCQVMGRPADDSWGANRYGAHIGRWTRANVWFPQNQIIKNMDWHQVNLLVFTGDQIYEGGSPANSEHEGRNPALDYLYRWYLWCWDFNRVTRKIPAICLTDDHDVYQGDLWGAGGQRSLNGHNKDGGYVHEAAFVRMVERIQTSHNPDAYDPTLIQQNIGVYYGAFKWGEISFCFLEDRKFKSLPTLVQGIQKSGSKIATLDFDPQKADIPNAKLLGDRQIRFLEAWIHDWEQVCFKAALMQTLFTSLHTDTNRTPWMDLDSNGWPQTARKRALRVLRKSHAFLLGGDTHLAAVVQHGVDDWEDANIQFVVPSVANKYRRWWNPKTAGQNRKPGSPTYLGRHFDGFHNKVTVYAVGNALLTARQVARLNQKYGNRADQHLLLDRSQVKDGYGIVRFNKSDLTITMECWPWNADPANGDRQFPHWPITKTIADGYGRKAKFYLPTLQVNGLSQPVIKITNEQTREIIYSLRTHAGEFVPKVFDSGTYTIWVGEPGTSHVKIVKNVASLTKKGVKKIKIQFLSK